MQTRFWRAAGLLVGSAAFAMGALAAPLKTGQSAPAWTGKTVQGKAITSAQYKGKVVLLNFFGYT